MIGSINLMDRQTTQVQGNQTKSPVEQLNNDIKSQLDNLKKTEDTNKKTSNNLQVTSKVESSEKTKDTENLMDTLRENENRSLVSSSSYAQANSQANRVSGMQAYSQMGKSVFSFS
jgi:hypothetical protein